MRISVLRIYATYLNIWDSKNMFVVHTIYSGRKGLKKKSIYRGITTRRKHIKFDKCEMFC